VKLLKLKLNLVDMKQSAKVQNKPACLFLCELWIKRGKRKFLDRHMLVVGSPSSHLPKKDPFWGQYIEIYIHNSENEFILFRNN
jgi:hypothetical protein